MFLHGLLINHLCVCVWVGVSVCVCVCVCVWRHSYALWRVGGDSKSLWRIVRVFTDDRISRAYAHVTRRAFVCAGSGSKMEEESTSATVTTPNGRNRKLLGT